MFGGVHLAVVKALSHKLAGSVSPWSTSVVTDAHRSHNQCSYYSDRNALRCCGCYNFLLSRTRGEMISKILTVEIKYTSTTTHYSVQPMSQWRTSLCQPMNYLKRSTCGIRGTKLGTIKVVYEFYAFRRLMYSII